MWTAKIEDAFLALPPKTQRELMRSPRWRALNTSATERRALKEVARAATAAAAAAAEASPAYLESVDGGWSFRANGLVKVCYNLRGLDRSFVTTKAKYWALCDRMKAYGYVVKSEQNECGPGQWFSRWDSCYKPNDDYSQIFSSPIANLMDI